MDFLSEINEQSGELTEWPKRCKYANLTFVIVPAKFHGEYWLEVRGSIHKLWEGTTNWQPFSFSQVQHVVEFVSNLCGLPLQSLEVRQCEFGVNLASPTLETADILNGLIGLRRVPFSPMLTNSGHTIGSIVAETDYKIKIYDKSAQYGLPSDVCRVEVHAYQHVERTFGIATLADLTNRCKMNHVGERLTGLISHITFDDRVADMSVLTPSQVKLLKKGRNPRNLKDMTRIDRCRHHKLIEEYGTLQIGQRLVKSVSEEWAVLLET